MTVNQKGRCRGCGNYVEIDPQLGDGHEGVEYVVVGYDHTSSCSGWGDGNCTCSGEGRVEPQPVPCGPVDVEPEQITDGKP